ESALGDARVRGPGAGCADRRATRWHAGMGRLDAGLDGAASSDDEAKPAALMVPRAAVALAVMLSVVGTGTGLPMCVSLLAQAGTPCEMHSPGLSRSRPPRATP